MSARTVLGFRPQTGSLIDKKNIRDFEFSSDDTQKIIDWIDNKVMAGDAKRRGFEN